MTDVQAHVRVGANGIGDGCPCYVIAEAGLNHNGDLRMAHELIVAAARSGADAVKFQKRTVDILAIPSVLDAPDTRFPSFGLTYREVREHLEFSSTQYAELISHARQEGLTFLCTPFDVPAIEFLEPFDLAAYKVASHSLTNLPMLETLAICGKPVIMSTGMCTLAEIDAAVDVFQRQTCPLALMHCVSAYPTPPDQCNLRMMDVLGERYGLPTGYSGHELGYLPTLAAVARGAAVIERHLTLSSELEGFDHRLSLEPHQFAAMVQALREIEHALGTGEKMISDTELVTRRKYHVSIVAAVPIAAGTVVTLDMLTLKNPGTGLPASRVPSLCGRRARRAIEADALLTEEMLDGSRDGLP